MIKVVFLGKYRELAGVDELALPACGDFAALAQALMNTSAELQQLLNDERLLIAVNHHLVSREQFSARSGDEVALMPPVTGG